jgi:hypothetical protein
MKKIIFLSSILIGVSCSSKDQQFCDCLKSGDSLNTFSSKLFDKEITPNLQKQLQKLKSTKASACKDYQIMSGEKMLKLKAECE